MRSISTTVCALALALLLASAARAEIKTETIDYKAGDTALKGYLAYDDAVQGKRPGILVMPEWWGLTDYPKHRAEQLAGLGYVAFAADMYGDGKTTRDPKEAGKWSGEVGGNKTARRAREQAALDVLKARDEVDPRKLGAIGYCFGGGIVLDMMRAGMPLAGVVSFHGSLSTDSPAQKDQHIKTQVLILHGQDDPLVPREQLEKLEKELKNAGVQYEVKTWPGAKHAFTNPGADSFGIDGIAYNKQADEQSWAAMKAFFDKLFPRQ